MTIMINLFIQPFQTCHRKIKSIPYPWIVVVLALVGQMGFSWPFQGLPVLYPFVREEFALSRAQVGLITSALVGGGAITVFLGGWVTDMIGVKWVMVGLLTTTGTLMIALLFTQSFQSVLIITLLIGIAGAPAFPAVSRAIMDWVPRQTRGLAMSIMMTGAPFGAALAAVVLPALALAMGWRLGTTALGGLILLTGCLYLTFYNDVPRGQGPIPKMDTATLRLILKNRSLVLAAIWASVFLGIVLIIVSYLVLYMMETYHVSTVVAGGYLAIAQVSSAIGRILWGAVSDFILGSRRLLVLITLGILTTAALTGISLTTSSTPSAAVTTLIIILGITAMSWSGVFSAFVGETAGISHTGTALGAVNTMMRISVLTLPPLFGLLVDMTGSYAAGWQMTAVVALISTVTLAIFGRESERL